MLDQMNQRLRAPDFCELRAQQNTLLRLAHLIIPYAQPRTCAKIDEIDIIQQKQWLELRGYSARQRHAIRRVIFIKQKKFNIQVVLARIRLICPQKNIRRLILNF